MMKFKHFIFSFLIITVGMSQYANAQLSRIQLVEKIADELHKAFYDGDNTQAGRRTTIAAGIATREVVTTANVDPSQPGLQHIPPGHIIYVTTGAANTRFPTATVRNFGGANGALLVPAGTPRGPAIARIVEGVMRQNGVDAVDNPRIVLAIVNGVAAQTTQIPTTDYAGDYLRRVVMVGMNGRPGHLHAEQAINTAFLNGLVTNYLNNRVDSETYDLRAIAANRAYCARCYIYLREFNTRQRADGGGTLRLAPNLNPPANPGHALWNRPRLLAANGLGRPDQPAAPTADDIRQLTDDLRVAYRNAFDLAHPGFKPFGGQPKF